MDPRGLYWAALAQFRDRNRPFRVDTAYAPPTLACTLVQNSALFSYASREDIILYIHPNAAAAEVATAVASTHAPLEQNDLWG